MTMSLPLPIALCTTLSPIPNWQHLTRSRRCFPNPPVIVPLFVCFPGLIPAQLSSVQSGLDHSSSSPNDLLFLTPMHTQQPKIPPPDHSQPLRPSSNQFPACACAPDASHQPPSISSFPTSSSALCHHPLPSADLPRCRLHPMERSPPSKPQDHPTGTHKPSHISPPLALTQCSLCSSYLHSLPHAQSPNPCPTLSPTLRISGSNFVVQGSGCDWVCMEPGSS